MSLSSNISSLATRIATQFKTVTTMITGSASGNLSGLTTSDKTSVVAAINEVRASAASATGINDGVTSSSSTWSSQKISNELANVDVDLTDLIDDTTPSASTVYSGTKVDSQIAAAKASILGGADPAYDTLLELQQAIESDDTEIAALTTALGNRVRHDVSNQGLTTTQQSNARTNIAAASAADVSALQTLVGSDVNYVTVFEAGLV